MSIGLATQAGMFGGDKRLASYLALQESLGSVAAWALDETSGDFVDRVGSYHLTPYGSPTTGAAGPISGSAAVTFNGSSQYASRTSSPLSGSLTAFTLEAWVNGAGTQNARAILAMGRSTTFFPFLIMSTGNTAAGQTNDNLRAAHRSDSNAFDWNEGGGTAFDSTWHHIALTYNGTTGIGYIDGSAVSGFSTTYGPLTTTLDRLTLAGVIRDAGIEVPFAGSIALPAIYDSALTSSEISTLYAASGL